MVYDSWFSQVICCDWPETEKLLQEVFLSPSIRYFKMRKMHLFPSPPSLCAWHQHSDMWQSLMRVLVHSDNVCLLFSHNSSALQQQGQTQPSPAGTTELNTEHPKTLCRLSIIQQYQPTSSAASSAHSALQGEAEPSLPTPAILQHEHISTLLL